MKRAELIRLSQQGDKLDAMDEDLAAMAARIRRLIGREGEDVIAHLKAAQTAVVMASELLEKAIANEEPVQ